MDNMEKNDISVETIERLVPDFVDESDATGRETLILHLERYEFACNYINSGSVLDIACGSGYGTYLIFKNKGEKLDSLTGVDVSQEAIGYANERYKQDKIDFVLSDALSFDSKKRYETIVSLETIEHLDDPLAFVLKIKSLLKKNGVVVASVPVTPSVDFNPHHKHDFTEKSFYSLFESNGFKKRSVLMQDQKYNPLKILFRKEKRAKDIRGGVFGFYLKNPTKVLLRFSSIIKDGFRNKYITAAWELVD